MLLLLVDALLQAARLLLARDVQEELEDDDVVVGEHALEVVDLLHVPCRLFRADVAVHPRRKHVLIVRAVEDADHALAVEPARGSARGSHAAAQAAWAL